MWCLEHFIPKLDGGILRQNMGCGPAGASSAQENGFLPGLCLVLSPHTASYGAALLGWDGVLYSSAMGREAIAQPLPAAGGTWPCTQPVSRWVPSQDSTENPEFSGVRSQMCRG